MRPTPPTPSKYRIKEHRGVFTIEKLITTITFNWFWGKRTHYDYHILTDRGNSFKPFIEAHPITEKFKTLEDAKSRLKSIISESEVKYHNL